MFNRKNNKSSPANYFAIQTVGRTIIVTVLVTMVLTAQVLAQAGGSFGVPRVLHFGTIARHDMTIVLATTNNVAAVEKPRPDDPNKMDPGFSFNLKFDQIIRPGKIASGVDDLDVAFARLSKLTNGEKVMVHLKQLKTGQWMPSELPGGIVVLKDFDQPAVEMTRKVCRLWEIPEPAKQLEKVIAGYRGDDDLMKSYCLSVLRDLDSFSTGLNLSGVIDSQMANSIIYEPYASTKTVSANAFSKFESIFWNKFRSLNWDQQEARYPLLSGTVDKIIADGEEIQHTVFDSMVKKLCFYPEHGQENYQRLLKVIDGKVDIYKFGAATNLSMIYHPHTTDPKRQLLNDEVFKKLVSFISDTNSNLENSYVDSGAAIALGNIALNYAKVGPVPEKFMTLLKIESDFDVSERVKDRLRGALKDVEATKPLKIDDDFVVLSYPWDNLLGKQVAVSATKCLHTGYGAAAETRLGRLWLEGLQEWPDGVSSFAPLQLTGRLKKVEDLPAFRYKPGQPFGDGLPVPDGFSLKKARTRYVLEDPSWKLIPK